MTSSPFLLSETYDFEFKKRWRPGVRFVLNSCWQGNLDYQQNIVQTKRIRILMKEFGLEVLKIVGQYRETLGDAECMVSFPPEEMELEEMKRFFYRYGRKYRQNCIFYIDEDGMEWVLPTRPNSTFGQIGRMIKVKRFVYQDFEELVCKFMSLTFEMDKVKIVTD